MRMLRMPRVHGNKRWWGITPFTIARAQWHVLLLGVLAGGGGSRASAQITYSVFPVTPAGPAMAQPTNPSVAAVTLSVQDSTIAYVVQTLAHQAHLRVAYNGNSPIVEKRITFRMTNAKIMDALAVALQGT
ncbi:MAG TPA: hypothetical protein VNU46_08875, partial [Gemmatimonadaceae bacterium]|nr:hypothetical protein [Gemmatimonadaceae bacterium]